MKHTLQNEYVIGNNCCLIFTHLIQINTKNNGIKSDIYSFVKALSVQQSKREYDQSIFTSIFNIIHQICIRSSNFKHLLMKLRILLILLAVFTQTFEFFLKNSKNSASYDSSAAKNYAAYASLAYCPKKCLQNWNCKTSKDFPKLVNVSHFNNDLTLAAVYLGYEQVSQTIIVSWRGSANAQNWIEDFTIQMEPFTGCKGCYIHVGFHLDYILNAKKIKSALKDLIDQKNAKKIVMTGHSLGASLATINALYFSLQNLSIPLQVYNFGSPRLANENLAQFIRNQIPSHYRIVHNRDLIPHLPPQIQYKHAAYEVFYSKDMNDYKICSQSGEDSSCSNKYFPQYNPADHDFYFMDMDPSC